MSAAVDLLNKLPQAFNADAAADVDAVVQYNISTPMHSIIKDGSCTVVEGEAADPTVTITMEDDDLVAMMTGELDGMTAFMTGKLQLEGDMMFAQRVAGFFDADKLS